MQIPPRANPRLFLTRHRERGRKRFSYTYDTISSVVGLKPETVRSQLPSYHSFQDVVTYTARKIAKRVPMNDADAIAWLHSTRRGNWDANWPSRWPPLNLFRCSAQRCETVLIGDGGYCVYHGGGQSYEIDDLGHFTLRYGQNRLPLHRILMNFPPGLDVHHVDRNPMNNRIENLALLTPEEHRLVHFGRLEMKP